MEPRLNTFQTVECCHVLKNVIQFCQSWIYTQKLCKFCLYDSRRWLQFILFKITCILARVAARHPDLGEGRLPGVPPASATDGLGGVCIGMRLSLNLVNVHMKQTFIKRLHAIWRHVYSLYGDEYYTNTDTPAGNVTHCVAKRSWFSVTMTASGQQ